jgi:hypothetical protein
LLRWLDILLFLQRSEQLSFHSSLHHFPMGLYADFGAPWENSCDLPPSIADGREFKAQQDFLFV